MDSEAIGKKPADVTGVILAGGKSTRMGRDKALLRVDGMPLFERVLRALQSVFSNILIAGDRPDLAHPELPCYPDLYPGSALGGLYTGLVAAETPYIFVAACDMPYPDPALIRTLLAQCKGYDIVVPRTPEGLEPLFAVYHKNCLPHIRAMLEAGHYRIFDFYPEVRTRYVEISELPADWQRRLLNLNTPQDYHRETKGENIMSTPVVSVVSKSGTGKTTLLEKMIAELSRRGYRVGVVKHDSHSFDMDHEGKDSWRLTQAGAATTVITSPAKVAMIKQNRDEREPTLAETAEAYFGDVDLVLTEGFKRSRMPKIEVHRQERSPSLMCRGEEYDDTLLAVASDSDWELDVPCFHIDDFSAICDLVEKRFLNRGNA